MTCNASILFNTLPKSGSVYITQVLAQGLQYKIEPICNLYFPYDVINHLRLRDFMQGGWMSQAHFDASLVNLQMLRAFNTRVVIHLRDPRQSLLSWAHHLIHLEMDGRGIQLLRTCPSPDRYLLHSSLTAVVDWCLENFLPSCIRWIRGWMYVMDSTSLPTMLTTYDEFIRDNLSFYHRVLDFYDIPREQFNPPEIPKDLTVHYRKGDPHEWRDVLTKTQREKATALIPEEFYSRFGWEK